MVRSVHVAQRHRFDEPGVYFVALRVSAQRDGTPGPYANVQNLNRICVVVHNGHTPEPGCAQTSPAKGEVRAERLRRQGLPSMETNQLGLDGPAVSRVCVGTSPLGGMPTVYGYDVDAHRAVATVRRVVHSSINFIDTSNEYGDGESERRIGIALRETEASSRMVMASKADPVKGSKVFDGERVLQSFGESVERLGLERLDVFYLHDPERFDFEDVTRAGGALDAARRLKADDKVGLIGVAGGDIVQMHRYLDTGHVDVVLNHNQFTLLDQSAGPLIEHARAVGACFVNAAPYASGVLAKPPSAQPRYQYRVPDPSVLRKVAILHQLCDQFEVPLPALALQFSTRDPRITSTVVGVSVPERVDELVRNEMMPIPRALWEAVAERFAVPVAEGT